MQNIKLEYMYRDGANYKNHGEAIFANPDNVTVDEALAIIQPTLFDGAWFYVNEWGLKDLHFEKWDDEIDHTWHEFVALASTTESITETRTFKQFLQTLNT